MKISEEFIILALKSGKAGYRIQIQALHAGLAGAFLMEMLLSKEIEIKDGFVNPASKARSSDEIHRQILDRIRMKPKPAKIRYWVNRIMRNTGKLKLERFEGLAHSGKLRLENKRFLFIKYREIYLIDKSLQKKLVETLRHILSNKAEADENNILLLALTQACKMQRVLTRNRMELKEFNVRLKEFLKSNEIALKVDLVLRELQAVVVSAIAVSVASTTAASS